MIRQLKAPISLARRISTSSPRILDFEPPNKRAEEQSNFLEQFIQAHEPEKRTIDYFSSNEWTRKVLNDGAYETVPFFSRYHNERTGENRFFAQKVNTETTIPHLLAFRLKDLKTPAEGSHVKDVPGWIATSPDVLCLLSLGRGLDAHPSIVHGGFQCVIFDEIARFLILVHQNAICRPGTRDIHYTLSMATKYFAPVTTPADVLVRAKLTRRDGRKWFAQSEIVNSTGQVLTSAESLWLTAKKP